MKGVILMDLIDLSEQILYKTTVEALEKEIRPFKEWNCFYNQTKVAVLEKLALKKMVNLVEEKENWETLLGQIDKIEDSDVRELVKKVSLEKLYCFFRVDNDLVTMTVCERIRSELSNFEQAKKFLEDYPFLNSFFATKKYCIKMSIVVMMVKFANTKKEWKYFIEDWMFDEEMSDIILSRLEKGELENLDVEVLMMISQKFTNEAKKSKFKRQASM